MGLRGSLSPVPAWPTWEVAPVGHGPVGGRVEAVVVPGRQVDDAVVQLVPFPGDQLAPEGIAGGGCQGRTQGQAIRWAPDVPSWGLCVIWTRAPGRP